MFKKGQSGNPKGRAVETNKKEFTDALRITLKEDDKATKRKNLRVVAEKLVECAKNGEGWAIKEIADRIEGKPQQTVEQKIDASVNIQLVDYSDYEDQSAK